MRLQFNLRDYNLLFDLETQTLKLKMGKQTLNPTVSPLSHLDAFALVAAADRRLWCGGRGGAFGCLGSLAGGH